jgi:hypothetical protein
MGWFIGDYVFAKRHNRDLEKPAVSALERVVAHVRLGPPLQPVLLNHPDAERAAALAQR